MLPSSIRTFWSLTHAPSTPLSVLVARATASFMASSKLVWDVALNSVTRATLIRICASLQSSLPGLVTCLICGPAARKPNIKAGTPRLPSYQERFLEIGQNRWGSGGGQSRTGPKRPEPRRTPGRTGRAGRGGWPGCTQGRWRVGRGTGRALERVRFFSDPDGNGWVLQERPAGE